MSVMTHTFYASPHSSDEAALRTRAQGIFDAFIACGWRQTDDTGQAVPSELTFPGTVSTVAGYGVFRLDDALQATTPVFTRMEFFRSASTNTGMVLRVEVGSATDGAGNIVGRQYSAAARELHGAGGTGLSEYLCYASGDGSSFNLVMYEGFQRCSMLAIERSRSASGIPTGESILVAASDPVSSDLRTRVSMAGTQGAYEASRTASWPYLPSMLPREVNGLGPTQGWSGISPGGGAAPVFPVALAAPGVTPWVSSNLLVVHPSDVAATSTRQRATINGAERTYRATSAWSEGGVVFMGAGNVARAFPAILWADEE